MEFRDYVRVLRRHWRFIVALAVIGALLGAGAAVLQPKRYTATARAFVSVAGAQTLNDQVTGITFAEEAAQGYATIATSAYVLQPVIDRLHLPNTPAGLAKRVAVTVADSSPVIQVVVTDSAPRRAAQTANAVVAQLSTAAVDLTPGDVTATPAATPAPGASAAPSTGSASTSAVKLTAVDLAPLAVVHPVGFSTPLAAVVGLLVGVVLGAALGLFRDLLDTRIRTREDLDRIAGAPVLGATLRDPRVGRRPLVALPGVGGPVAEAYRGLRTSLRFVQLDPARPSFVITSSIEGEGKSVTASNLALALAGVGSRVLLVDADLRRPRIAACFEVDGTIGLSDVLIGAVHLDDTVQSFGATGVDLLPAGSLPPNPNELLQSPAMRELLQRLHRDWDVVLFDSPPLLAVSDAVLLGEQAGAVIVVAASGRVRRQQLESALDGLQAVGARIAGLVLTMVPRKGPDGQQYGYGYGSDRASHDASAAVVPQPSADWTPPAEKAVDRAAAPDPVVEDADPMEDRTDRTGTTQHEESDDREEPHGALTAATERIAAAVRSGDDGGFIEIAAAEEEPSDGPLDLQQEDVPRQDEPRDAEAEVLASQQLPEATTSTRPRLTLVDLLGEADRDEDLAQASVADEQPVVETEPASSVDAAAAESPSADGDADAAVSPAADEPARRPRRFGRRSRRAARAERTEQPPVEIAPVAPAAPRRSSAKPVRIAPPPDLAQRLRRQSDSRSA